MYPEMVNTACFIASTVSEGLGDPFVGRLTKAAMSAVSDLPTRLTLAIYDPCAIFRASR